MVRVEDFTMNEIEQALLVRCIERVVRMDESFAASCEMTGDVASGRDWRGEIAELTRLRDSIKERGLQFAQGVALSVLLAEN